MNKHSPVIGLRRFKYKLLNGYRTGMNKRRITVCSLGLLFISFVVLFICPLLFYLSTSLQEFLIFRASSEVPQILHSPEAGGLNNTRAFFIPVTGGLKLGAWHLLPAPAPLGLVKESAATKTLRFEEELLKEGSVVVIYFHGNTPSRAQGHRISLYMTLAKLGCHVITFDYRSFADSSPAELTQKGLLSDGVQVYDYVRARTASSTSVVLWGHSLGTGISSGVAAMLCARGSCPDGLALHAGFTDLPAAVADNYLALAMRWTPWFDFFVLGAIRSRGLLFNTTSHITQLSCPLLILHAQDDAVIPVAHSIRLYDVATAHSKYLQSRGVVDAAGDPPPVTYVEFGADLGYGHNGIVRAPELARVAGEFLQSCHEYHQKPLAASLSAHKR